MSGLKCDASVSAAASPILCVCVRRLNTLATVWNCVGCGAAVLRWRRVGWMKRETHSKQLCFHTSRYVTRSLSGRTPPIRQPALQQQWSLPNRFHTAQGHSGACRKRWRLTESDLCSRGKTQTMSTHALLWSWMAFCPHSTLPMMMRSSGWQTSEGEPAY